MDGHRIIALSLNSKKPEIDRISGSLVFEKLLVRNPKGGRLAGTVSGVSRRLLGMARAQDDRWRSAMHVAADMGFGRLI
jgi:hypothetical protein